MKKIISILLLVTLCIGLSMPVAADDNLLKNSSFEDPVSGSRISNWTTYDHALRNSDSKYVRTGSFSLKITTDTYNYPYSHQYWTTGLVDGAEYTASVWVYAMNPETRFCFRYSYLDKDGNYISEGFSQSRYTAAPGGWELFTDKFRIPKGTVRVIFALRMSGTGTVYLDDVSCMMTDGPEKIYETAIDGTFYYTERTEPGVMTAEMDTGYYPALIGKSVHFVLAKDGTAVKTEDVTIPTDGHVSFTFSLTLLEKQTPYTVSCTYREAGEADVTKSYTVYKYDRPTRIDENGFFHDENDEIFTPSIMYRVGLDDLDMLKAAGINAVQGYTGEEWLNALQERGMKSFIVLYADGKSAGNPDRLGPTISYVNRYKDHPAVFGWLICDEPPTTETSLSELVAAYTSIRAIDPEHPVVITANSGCDILHGYVDAIISDSYPSNNGRFLTHQGVGVGLAVQNSADRPIYALLQAFENLDSFPTPTQLRNMQYASLFAGAKGLGYYRYHSSRGDTWLCDTELWEPLCNFGKNEQSFVYDIFVYQKYPKVDGTDEDTHEWGIWQTGTDYFLIVRSKTNDVLSVSVPLSDFNAVEVERIFGTPQAVRLESGALNVVLPAADTAVFRLSPGGTNLFGADANNAFIPISGTATSDNFSVKSDGSLYLVGTSGMRNPSICYTFPDKDKLQAGKNYVLRFRYKPLSAGQSPIVSFGKSNSYQDSYLMLSGSAFRTEEKTDGFTEFTAYFTMPEIDSTSNATVMLTSYGGSSDGYYDGFYLAEDSERVVLTDETGLRVGEIRGDMMLGVDIHYIATHEKTQGEQVTMLFALYRETGDGKQCVDILLQRADLYNKMPVLDGSNNILYLTSAADLRGNVVVPPGEGTYSYKCFYWNDSLQSLRAAMATS